MCVQAAAAAFPYSIEVGSMSIIHGSLSCLARAQCGGEGEAEVHGTHAGAVVAAARELRCLKLRARLRSAGRGSLIVLRLWWEVGTL